MEVDDTGDVTRRDRCPCPWCPPASGPRTGPAHPPVSRDPTEASQPSRTARQRGWWPTCWPPAQGCPRPRRPHPHRPARVVAPRRRGRRPAPDAPCRWAPTDAAIPSFMALVSTAITRPAPAILAPCTTARPTPPQPTTSTVSPGRTRATLNTAPRPVVTPQPARQITSSGMSGGTTTSWLARTTTSSASVPAPTNG